MSQENICVIVAPQNRNGILDRIGHEAVRLFPNATFHYGSTGLPKSDRYFVTHYSMLNQVMMQVNPGITPVTAFFTHDKGGLVNFVDSMNLCQSVIAESPEGMKLLAFLGVRQDILHFVPEGGDNEAFEPHSREATGPVLVCATNYPDGRKNPALIYAIARLMPHRTFYLVGAGWRDYSLDASPNIVVMSPEEFPYSTYPKIFRECSVFLSAAKLEGGGPNALIEAMHANLVPVVSDTGNARQYIVDQYNGFIFDTDAEASDVAPLIERAYSLRPQDSLPYADVWQTVRHQTWREYSLNMYEIISGDYSTTISQNLDDNDYEVEDDPIQ